MKNKISPSMMCADLYKIRKTIKTFEKEKIDYLHIDVMDGVFVKNYALGVDYIKALKKKTNIPFDIHLMVESPEDKINYFPIDENDMVSVHIESTNNINKAISLIKEKNAIFAQIK